MKRKDTERGDALLNFLKSDAIVSVGKEYAEIGIDSVLESGVLKDIPFVNTVIGAFNAGSSIRDHFFSLKLLRFLKELASIPESERIALGERLNDDDKFAGKAGSAILEIIDRLESEKKPELAAQCFAVFARQEVTYDDLRRLLVALERLPSFDLAKVRDFSNTSIERALTMDESLLLAFVNSGLGKNNGGFDGGAIMPTKLCKLFVKIGLAP